MTDSGSSPAGKQIGKARFPSSAFGIAFAPVFVLMQLLCRMFVKFYIFNDEKVYNESRR